MQRAVTTSTAKAEYFPLCATAQEFFWLGAVLALAKVCLDPRALPIKVENERSIKMAENDASGNHIKHVDIG